jgi:hypothetical protein
MKQIYPKKYNKEEFKKFLEKNDISEIIIDKFNKLPEMVESNKNKYKLYINSIWYNVSNAYYNFELNYYSEELIEYLFNSKVFNDIELSINNLICELQNSKIIIGDCK